jgi:hypothetical protein
VFVYSLLVYNLFTNNEKKVLRYLLVNSSTQFSMNQIAKGCKLSPNGGLKILKKFEGEGVCSYTKVGNVKSYHLNFESRKTVLALQLALLDDKDIDVLSEIEMREVKTRV